MAKMSPLPDYASMLRAYHRGFAVELEAMIATLPIEPGQRILEVACGDGTYTTWLARRAGETGFVVGLDLSFDFLQFARDEVARAERQASASGATWLVEAAIERLPFAARGFDMVWCAQSLFSLPEPRAAVERMAEMARPGGVVAVLEDDTLHQVLLPWPVEVELAVRLAEWAALNDRLHPRKFYVGRRLVELFRQVGLVEVTVRTFASDRIAPLDPDVRTFLAEYLRQLRVVVADRLDPAIRDRFDSLVDPASGEYLPDAPNLALTVIDHVVRGRTGR